MNRYSLLALFTTGILISCEEDDLSWKEEIEQLREELDAKISEDDRMLQLTDNPLEQINVDPGFTSIFKTWGFIGDSFCSGTMRYQDEETGEWETETLYDYSWGQSLCRLTGSTGTNFSKGGMWSTGWLTEPASYKTWALAKNDPKQAYIIALGYNDLYTYKNVEKGNLATDVDLNDYTKNAETYAGNMAGIIQRLKSINKDAFFFVVTLPNEPLYSNYPTEEWNDVVRGLPDLFTNTYVIDLYKYAPVYDDAFKEKYYLTDHMSPAGYQFTAYMFCTYIDWIVRKNPTDFSKIFLAD